MLAEKGKQYDKQVKGYKKRDVVTNASDTVASDLEFVENCTIICFAFIVRALS